MKLNWQLKRSARVSNEKGIVLPIVLMFLTIITVIGTVALTTTGVDLKITSNYKTGTAALHLAEAGADYVWRHVDQNLDVDTYGGPDKTQVFTNNVSINFNSSSVLAGLQSGATGTVTVARDGSDNTKATITSNATLAGSTQQVVLIVKSTPGSTPVPPIPAAISTVSPGTDEFEREDIATGVEESGDPSCPDKAGLLYKTAVTGDTPSGGTPPQRKYDAATDDPIFNDPAAMQALIDQWAALPTAVQVNGMAGHPTTMGTQLNPQITVWSPNNDTGQNDTNAAITGYGILIIKGRNVNKLDHWFDFAYDINFHGLILFDSSGELHFLTANSVIHGAVIAVSTKTGSEATSVHFFNGSDLKYNCVSLSYASSLVGGSGVLSTLSWKQG